MSARGFLVTNPKKKSSKVVSESARYIPLFWLGFLSSDSCDGEEQGRFELDRNDAVERAENSLPFLAEVFSGIRVFEDSATALLDRLRRLRCPTIGIDIAELVEYQEPPDPDLKVAVKAIESRNRSFKLSLPARTVDNPYTGGKTKIKARKISSTEKMLLEVCCLTDREIASFGDDEYRELVIGHVWK